MIKLQTGVSTDMDFIKAMKEKGQDVSAEFPAETLRKQFDEISENDITFNMTNESFLEEVANGDEPTPIEKVTVTVYVTCPDCLDNPNVRIGEEVITDLPAELTEDKGTELPVSITCVGCEDYEGTIVFDEDKEIDIKLERAKKTEATVTFEVGAIFECPDSPSITVGDETITEFPATMTKTIGTELNYTASCDGYITETGTIVFDDDKTFTIELSRKQFVSIEIIEPPTKTDYFLGEQIDLTGMEVEGVYDDDTREPIQLTNIDCTPSTAEELGELTITIRYDSTYTDTFTVNVEEESEDSI